MVRTTMYLPKTSHTSRDVGWVIQTRRSGNNLSTMTHDDEKHMQLAYEQALTHHFIEEKPELWVEDISETQPS